MTADRLAELLRSVRPPSPKNSSTNLATGNVDDRERGDVADLPVPGPLVSPSPKEET